MAEMYAINEYTALMLGQKAFEIAQQLPSAEHHDTGILHLGVQSASRHFTASPATAYEATLGEEDSSAMSNGTTAPGLSASSLLSCT